MKRQNEYKKIINIITRLQNMRQKLYPTVPVSTYQLGETWHKNSSVSNELFLYKNPAKYA